FSITCLCLVLRIRSGDQNTKDFLMILIPLTLQMGISTFITYMGRTTSFSLQHYEELSLLATISTVLLTAIILLNLSRYLLRLLPIYKNMRSLGYQIVYIAIAVFLLLSFFFVFLFSKGDWSRTLPLTVNNFFSGGSALMIFHGFTSLFHLKEARGREEESLLKGVAITFLPLIILFPLDLLLFKEYSFKLGYTVFSLFAIQIYLYVSRHYFREYEPDTDLLEEDIFFKTAHLSEREEEVARLLIQGKTNKDIAEQLFVSVNTIKSHIKKIYSKLGVNNRIQLIHLIKGSLTN
ncbi:MAG: helix-turn-helix transcriptional regulator, partial [Spirochaetales bacterium]|nr:helix-turn-helix transcriptional regulator [Spirochaetales bacterium]